ncbi:response regulator [Luteolibacter sp. GHJ8]|uniref:histidine kinase n=1 Tax=Luteolibacter rhizosphaerae TaxID=2989719 RepID=A0ABT3G0G2_9BACT|nr:response regulator [Luteolibacter rhizosphaerae]MCW1913157.1 response regulator [Luteolibacter rhizosphaerae]
MEAPDTLHLLLIEDSPDDRVDVRRMLLQGSERRIRFSEATSGAEALRMLAESERVPDCILLDFNLPDMDAIEILGHLRAGGELTLCPVVVLTGSTNSGSAVLPAGAQDYLSKRWASPEILVRAIENARERYALAVERKRAADLLRVSEEFSRTVLQSSPDCVKVIDRSGRIISLNEPGRCLLELDDPSVMVGREWASFWPEGSVHEVRAAVEGALKGELIRFRQYSPTFKGTAKWWDVQVSPVLRADGSIDTVVAVSRDITESKRVEMHLAEISQRKDEFLAMLAHELRNPLAPLLTGMEVILASPGDTERVNRIAGMMKRQIDQMSHLIDDLLDVSRINSGKIELQMSPVFLDAVLKQSVEATHPLVERSRHQLTVRNDVPELMLTGDHHRLAQVISNLLTNAAKYTPDGGKIELTATTDADGMLNISVKDNGKGIAPEHQVRIFDLFDQGASGPKDGLGIGLTLVKSLVSMHGGSIAVRSEGEGKGSEFIVKLPILTGGAAVEEEKPPLPKEEPSFKRVLVADDGKATADILGMFFEMEGMSCRVVYDGGEAVEEARRFKPDLLCFDIGMPVLNGYEAARRVREILPDAYLVALSGWGAEEDRRKSELAGFDEHLVKPVGPDELRHLLRRAFRASQEG